MEVEQGNLTRVVERKEKRGRRKMSWRPATNFALPPPPSFRRTARKGGGNKPMRITNGRGIRFLEKGRMVVLQEGAWVYVDFL